MNVNPLDGQTPGGVYLCQISERISCGACCGLYNVADPSREGLSRLLGERSDAFADVPRNMDAILSFKREVESMEDQDRPFADFHHCPYIGLVGGNRSRVGCLLHPLAAGNGGVDWRGVSYYGGMACRVYFCPSCRDLTRSVKEIIRETAGNWHQYGLIVTEATLVNAFFSELERRVGAGIARGDVVGNGRRVEVIREFLNLKIDWPHRARPGDGVCNYFFEEGLYTKPRIEYEAVGARPSRYDLFMRELVSSFRTQKDLLLAEERLDRLFTRAARAFRG